MIRLDAVQVGDDLAAWTSAGFESADGSIVVDATAIECTEDDRPPTWRLWADGAHLPSDIDGIATAVAETPREPTSAAHPNRVVEIDHVVLASPDLDRTTEAFERLGVECRRIREIPGSEPAMQQRFFRFGPVILELVGTAEPAGDGPASIWGFAFTVDDIDAAAAHLGAACGAPKVAVQPGRRIATVRTRDLGISLPVAFMTPPPKR
ncbi:MAG: VOC family protein [Acidimicrobiales bacterium]|nr:VOC family protein [Acidimicrobiales bacterium]